MEISGYNKGKIEALYKTIRNTYDEVVDGVADQIQAVLIDPMSEYWYAPEAQDYFDAVVADIKTMGQKMQEAYQIYGNWIQQAGQSWADNTGGNPPSACNISPKDIKCKNRMKKDKGGSVILDEANAYAVAAKMASLHADCLATVKNAHSKLNAESAFIGHGQAAAASECFVRTADAINKLFSVLESIGDDLKKFADKYKDAATQIASKLGSANISVSGN